MKKGLGLACLGWCKWVGYFLGKDSGVRGRWVREQRWPKRGDLVGGVLNARGQGFCQGVMAARVSFRVLMVFRV